MRTAAALDLFRAHRCGHSGDRCYKAATVAMACGTRERRKKRDTREDVEDPTTGRRGVRVAGGVA